MHLFKPKECTTIRVNPDVNYGLWVKIMCQCTFMNCYKCPTLEGMLIVGEAMEGGLGAGGIWDSSVLSTQ